MKGTSKVIMGATLVLVVSLALVLCLILVLLAELYCSLLLRRRRLRTNAAESAATAPSWSSTPLSSRDRSSPLDHHNHNHNHNHNHHVTVIPTTPLSTFYSQGVLQAPRSLLFPAVSFKEDAIDAKKQQLSELCNQVIDIPTNQIEPMLSTPSSPQPTQEEGIAVGNVTTTTIAATTSTSNDKHFVYISNPIYENADNGVGTSPNTPFETPDSSPSRLEEIVGSGSSGEEEVEQSSPLTPPLTPMKKLPAEASSVSLTDARSLATNSGSDSNCLSSSSSGSPCTSPSW